MPALAGYATHTDLLNTVEIFEVNCKECAQLAIL